MTAEKQAYDALDAFCAEYGFDAATTQRMREYVPATAPAREDQVEFPNALIAG
jgi:hypothetical protein